jgi:hypothetical protein
MVLTASGESPFGTTVSRLITIIVSPWTSTDSGSRTNEE